MNHKPPAAPRTDEELGALAKRRRAAGLTFEERARLQRLRSAARRARARKLKPRLPNRCPSCGRYMPGRA